MTLRTARVIALVGALGFGCSPFVGAGPPHFSRTLTTVMLVPDFGSSIDSGDDINGSGSLVFEGPSLVFAFALFGFEWSPETIAAIDAVGASMRLTRVRDGQSVAGEARHGWYDMNGDLGIAPFGDALSFVPGSSLEPGWHVLSIDLSPWADLGVPLELSEVRHEGNVLYARFRVDSRPTWHGTRVTPVRGGEWPAPEGASISLVGRVSELIVDWGATSIEVHYGALPAPCTLPALGDGGFRLSCVAPADGTTVEIRLDSERVTDPEARRPAVHTFVYPPPQRYPTNEGYSELSPGFGLDAAGVSP